MVIAVAVLWVPGCWSGSKLRQTNIDLIASKLKTDCKPGDLVIVAPWFNACSLCRYYPSAGFVTLPPMEEVRIQRYDLMKRAMQSPDPISGLANRAYETLHSGHTLWIVGSLLIPARGEEVLRYPPYYKRIGNNDAAYYYSWAKQIGRFVSEHAVQGGKVDVPALYDVNRLENLNLIAVSGWHD